MLVCSQGKKRNYRMLIFTRRVGEAIMIGDDIKIRVCHPRGTAEVRIGIEAPKHIAVHREEVYERIQEENRAEEAAKDL